jgi:hypothetical protein
VLADGVAVTVAETALTAARMARGTRVESRPLLRTQQTIRTLPKGPTTGFEHLSSISLRNAGTRTKCITPFFETQ